jgi:hypothetical protein
MEPTPGVVGTYVCDMPMFFFKKLQFLSYGMAATSTIFWYYISSAAHALRLHGGSPTVLLFLLFGFIVFTLLQWSSLYVQTSYAKCLITWIGILTSVGVGSLVGVLTFGLTAGLMPQNIPYMSTEKFTTLSMIGPLGKTAPPSLVKDDASSAPSNVEKSSKPDDKDEFVCDLYKNGQLVTSTISE